MAARICLPVAALALLAACEAEPSAREVSAAAEQAPAAVTMTSVSPAEVGELQMLANEAVLLDVRTPEEFAEGHIEGASNIDFQAADFAQQIAALPRDRKYVVYCRSGRRSAGAQEKMAELGFSSVANMEGGILAWREIGLPTVQ